ncbi:TonB-dependent receptor plug domain-containing protein [Marinobacter caseinilyticus]|uniref:TonB-dependent receptor plug domain-containing protein n=1 Tax=Marinobacter caseinilyticus TaxID=2692195 RepID=UPI001F3935C8|nr:TonB-dependent receptor [Marinobacter caseinilyticus]
MILPASRNVYKSVFNVLIGVAFTLALPAYGQSDLPEPQWGAFDSSGTEEDYSFLLESPVPEVLTTTRLRQPKSKVPGTTTVLQGDFIRQLGILNLVEVFRLVPGMTVAEVGSNKPVTSYHGTVAYDQRRLQVQIDGRTAYQPNLAGVEWQSMPVAIESIERIEISRGPNAAAYGINAFLATINIITKSPEDTQGVNLHASYGRGGHKTFYGSVGGVDESYQWRLAYQRREDDGFDFQIESSMQEPFNDGYSFNLLTYDANKPLGNGQSLDIRLGVTEGVDEEDRLKADNFETQPNILVNDYYLQTRWNVTLSSHHFFHLQASYQDYGRRQRWRWCPDGFGRCFTTNQDIDESRLEFELQDTFAFTPDVRLVSGLDYRQDRVESDTYFNGIEHNYQARVFANLEYTPLERLTFNFGGNYETTTNLDGGFFSPRVAANIQLAEHHTLRFVFSKAVRIPSTFEQNADWGYRMSNVEPPGPNGEFEGERFLPDLYAFENLEPFREERIISREISYFGQHKFNHSLLSFEVKYFHDHIRDVISGFLSPEDWNLENNVALDQQGFEVETSLEFRESQFRASYAYMDQNGEYRGQPQNPPLSAEEKEKFIDLESRLTAQHSGSLAWIQRYDFDITTAAAFYFVDSFKRNQFQRADLRVAKAFHQPRFSYELAFIMQHYFDDFPPQSVDNNIKDLNQYFVEASMRF